MSPAAVLVSPTSTTRGEWSRWRHHRERGVNGGRDGGSVAMGVLTGLGPTDGGEGEDDDKGTHASRRTTNRKVGFHVAMAGKSTRATWPRRPTPSYADDCLVHPSCRPLSRSVISVRRRRTRRPKLIEAFMVRVVRDLTLPSVAHGGAERVHGRRRIDRRRG